MMSKHFSVKLAMVTACACLALVLEVFGASADAPYGERKHGGKRKRSHGAREYTYTMPDRYKERCGSCHMAYGAYLLPAASWRRLLDSSDHFGNALGLEASEKEELSNYLLGNAADRNGGRLGGKIMKHSGGSTPDRISTSPYIRRKHRKVAPAVFTSVGGAQNCIACHAGAEQGDFDEKRVRMP